MSNRDYPLRGSEALTPLAVNRAIGDAIEETAELAASASSTATTALATADTATSDILTAEQRIALLETNLILLARHLAAQGIEVPDVLAEQI
jgi:hypothetical protein